MSKRIRDLLRTVIAVGILTAVVGAGTAWSLPTASTVSKAAAVGELGSKAYAAYQVDSGTDNTFVPHVEEDC